MKFYRFFYRYFFSFLSLFNLWISLHIYPVEGVHEKTWFFILASWSWIFKVNMSSCSLGFGNLKPRRHFGYGKNGKQITWLISINTLQQLFFFRINYSHEICQCFLTIFFPFLLYLIIFMYYIYIYIYIILIPLNYLKYITTCILIKELP